ncbi:hypothetical protein GQ55_9G626100 [Panicum hallii var. hallii]|uniref:Uncharacterized protein n=1 Tax=Panicum hallii var. hallii TaxID=1504633 RepID=A0A2T7CI22_9POAL|nr:hypothetical protein GQ55_9G626100 [Panicum hallii var. hallii]
MMVHQKKMTQRSGVGSSFVPRIRAMLRCVCSVRLRSLCCCVFFGLVLVPFHV